ncbi:MAG: hypothetical protein IT236_03680 [Bacteroidia bacterium]|nr:hypothetical protein [Bacteroidia bacterium]
MLSSGINKLQTQRESNKFFGVKILLLVLNLTGLSIFGQVRDSLPNVLSNQGIRGITIGQKNMEAVIAKFGKTKLVKNYSWDRGSATKYCLNYKGIIFEYVSTKKEFTLGSITITGANYLLPDSVTIGTTEKRLLELFGKAKEELIISEDEKSLYYFNKYFDVLSIDLRKKGFNFVICRMQFWNESL